MNFLTIDEYLDKFTQKLHMQNYLEGGIVPSRKAFPPQVVKQGMLKWEDESACCWGGPFDGNYVFCKIEDHSLTLDLKSLAEIAEHWKTYTKYSTYNTLRGSVEKYFPDFKDGSFPQISSKGTKCGRSQFTHQELLHYIDKCTPDEFQYRLEKVDTENIDLITGKELSIELPVEFYLYGTDDTSWTNYYATVDEALVEFDYIVKHQPDIERIQRTFVFTN